jgi:hypothetical protein
MFVLVRSKPSLLPLTAKQTVAKRGLHVAVEVRLYVHHIQKTFSLSV